MSQDQQLDQNDFEASVNQTLDVILAFKRKRSKKNNSITQDQKEDLKSFSKPKSDINKNPIQLQPMRSQYEMREKKGEGGMKCVYKAKDLQAVREIAYAKIRQDKETTLNYRRFIREARITALLEHPNIIPVHDVGVNEEGKPYFTMKYLEGKHLQDVLKKLSNSEGLKSKEFSPQRLLDIFLDCCRAIAYAHSKGILHLDIKPSNIHLSHFGEVLVLDWGIASFIGEHQDKQEVESIHQLNNESTMAGTLKGTPGFMAPEQIDPELASLSERTDIYQLGCLLYALLTYVPPLTQKTVEATLKAALDGDIKPPSTQCKHKVPPALEAVVSKAMSLKPEDRYLSVVDLINDIQAYQDGYSTKAWKAGLWNLTLLAYRRHHVKIITGVAFTFVLMLTVLLFMIQLFKSNRAALRARDQAETLASKVTEALEVAKQKEREAQKSDRQLNDLRDGIKGGFDIARDKLPKLIDQSIGQLKSYGKISALKFLMENDYQSFLEFPYDGVWMVYENESLSDERYKQLIAGIRHNPDLDLETFDQLINILTKMRMEEERVSVEECHLALSILRERVKMSPNALAAFVMRRYHQRYIDDPTYPEYVESLFEMNSRLGKYLEQDTNDLKINIVDGKWDVELNSTVKELSLSILAFLPIRSFKARGCWCDTYVTMSTWPIVNLDLQSSGFRVEKDWNFKKYQLDVLRIVDCPFMNWPRLVDTLPAKKVIVSRKAAEYLNQKYMAKRGVELLLD